MTYSKLLVKEILHRKTNFFLWIFSVIVTVICVIASLAFLNSYKNETRKIITKKENETKKRVATLQDDYRKITKKMGFNVLIIPKNQNLNDFYSNDFASKYMPENYVDKLANSKIFTIRHLLPVLQQKLNWQEKKRTIILIGTRGEVPNAFKSPLKPLRQPVNPGEIILGYELHNSLNISTGDYVTLLGKKFRVAENYPERGNKDDITAWIDLKEAQTLLNKQNKINGILALECSCAWADLPNVRKEISKILPDTKILESSTKALARAETRNRAAQEAVEALAAEKAHRIKLLNEQKRLVFYFIPAVTIAAGIWIFILSLVNARERKYEMGLLGSLGFQSKNILLLFLAKAAAIGFAGALIGGAFVYFLGQFIIKNFVFININNLLIILFASILLSVIAAFLPAVSAAKLDPADILREE